MRAGDLNRQVTVQSRSASKDSVGGQSTTWSTVKTTWARIEALTISQKFAAAGLQTDVTHRLTLRYDSALWADPRAAATYRIVYGTRYFEIKGMENVREGDWEVVLLCAEGLADG